MHSTSAPSDPPIEATLFDGVSGHPHRVTATVEGDRLQLAGEQGWNDSIDRDDLKRLDSSGPELRLGRAGQPGWRLLVPSREAGRLDPLLGEPERYGRWIDRIGLVPALVAGAILTAAVVGVGYIAPHWLAPHIPMSWERRFGSAMVGDFGSNRCRNPDGQRALQALVERVAPGSTAGPDGIKVAALDVPIFNAAALPGGYIVVFKPAITETDSDALAGILAHEVTHVKRRHVTEALIREYGIGAIIRMFGGGAGTDAEQIVSLDYTRENEAQADSDAIEMLRKADISPLPTAQLFQKLSKDMHEGAYYDAAFLRSHPLSAERARRFAASFDPKRAYRSALSPDQDDALFNICWKGPASKQ